MGTLTYCKKQRWELVPELKLPIRRSSKGIDAVYMENPRRKKRNRPGNFPKKRFWTGWKDDYGLRLQEKAITEKRLDPVLCPLYIHAGRGRIA